MKAICAGRLQVQNSMRVDKQVKVTHIEKKEEKNSVVRLL